MKRAHKVALAAASGAASAGAPVKLPSLEELHRIQAAAIVEGLAAAGEAPPRPEEVADFLAYRDALPRQYGLLRTGRLPRFIEREDIWFLPPAGPDEPQ